MKLFRYLRVLNFGDAPNYEFLKKLMSDEIAILDKKGINTDSFNRWGCLGKFDWIDDRDDVKAGKHTGFRDERTHRLTGQGLEREKRSEHRSSSKHKERYMR